MLVSSKKLIFYGGEWQKVDLDCAHPDLELAEIKEKEKVEKRIKKEVVAKIEKTCGNCKSIRYKGIHSVTHVMGQCSKWKESKRDYVSPGEDGCYMWSRRTDYMMQIEIKRSMKELEKVRRVKK